MDTIPATEMLKNNYLTYGEYINNGRATVCIDGLKNVERRVLLSVKHVASSKLTSSAEVIGNCIAYYHPHGIESTYDVLCKLVTRGLVEGHGSFGSYMPDDSPAAMRYTKVKAVQSINESIFKLVNYVEQRENEFGNLEPINLPTPIPLALATTGSRGIGVGLLSMIPMFSAESLYKALHKDSPSHLKGSKGVDIVTGDLKKIWETGEGLIQYGLNVYQEKNATDDKVVSIIEGSPKLFYPNLAKVFEDELEDESIYIRDESRAQIRLIISRVKGLKRITDDQVHEKAKRAAVKTVFCRIYVSDGKAAIRMGLREWLQRCWKNYTDAVDNYKDDQITKLNEKLEVYNLIPAVYPLLIKGMKTKAISGTLNKPMKIIREIEGRPMRLLRKPDFDAEITATKSEIRQIEKVTADDLGKTCVSSLSVL